MTLDELYDVRSSNGTGLPVEVDALSMYRAFEQIQDGRQKRGVRYSSALILTLIVLAKLAGMTSLAGIAEWVRLRATWLKQVLPNPYQSFPCAATYSNVVRTLNAQQVTQVLNNVLTRVGAMRREAEHARLVERAAEEEARGHVALDGKTLRGTLGHTAADQKKMHQLTLYDTQTGVLLKEQVTGEKQNELSIVSAVPDPRVGQRTHHLGRCFAYPACLLFQYHPLGWATMCSSPRTISPHWPTTCACFSRNRLMTAAIGVRHARSTKDMDGWKSAN